MSGLFQLTSNAEWLATHATAACAMAEQPDTFLTYVKTHHQYGGCATRDAVPPQVLLRSLNVEQLALFADAVTAACFEFMGRVEHVEKRIVFGRYRFVDMASVKWNDADIGNMALVALRHSDPRIRAKWSEHLAKLQAFVRTMPIPLAAAIANDGKYLEITRA